MLFQKLSPKEELGTPVQRLTLSPEKQAALKMTHRSKVDVVLVQAAIHSSRFGYHYPSC